MEKSPSCRLQWLLLLLLGGSLGITAASSPLTYLVSVLDSVMLSKPELRKNTAYHRALEYGKYRMTKGLFSLSDLLLIDENSHNHLLFNLANARRLR